MRASAQMKNPKIRGSQALDLLVPNRKEERRSAWSPGSCRRMEGAGQLEIATVIASQLRRRIPQNNHAVAINERYGHTAWIDQRTTPQMANS